MVFFKLVHRSFAFTFLLLAFLPFGAKGDTFDQIKSRGVLKWGADAEGGAPYVFPDRQDPNRLTGFEYDLADALAGKLGVKAEMVQNQWEGLVPGLQRGNFDIIMNGLEITPEHQQQIAMSRPYYAYAQQIMVRKETEGVQQLEDLKGKAVGVLAATVAQRLVEKMGGVDVRVYPGNVESFRDLSNRRIDAVLLDLPIALYYSRTEQALKSAGQPFAPGFYGIGVRKEDQSLLEAINRAISELIVDGGLERIYTRYGLWDRYQESLRDYRQETVVQQKPASTWREWRRYLPLLLRGALVTVEISCLSMALAVGAGLLLALARMYGVAPLRWFGWLSHRTHAPDWRSKSQQIVALRRWL